MDLLSYFLIVTNRSSAISSALRLCVLAATAAVGFTAARQKRAFYVTFCALAVFALLHFAFSSVYAAPSAADAVNLVRIFSLPVTAVSFAALIDADKRTLPAVFGAVTAVLAVIIAVMLASTLTGTDPHTYPGKMIGTLGWFSGTNSQSAIISMAFPFALAYASERSKKPTLAVLAVSMLGSAALFFLATRLAYAAIFGVAFSFFIGELVFRGCRKRIVSPAIFLVAPVLAAVLFWLSPMMSNRQKVDENAAIKESITESVLMHGNAEDLYRHYLRALTDRFGFDAVFAAYGETLDTSVLTDSRLAKITYSRLLMSERPKCRAFGLDLPSMTFGGTNFDAENDFHGIYFLCGSVGLILLLAFALAFAFPFARAVLKHPCGIDHYQIAAFAALACGVVHAYFTAGVLRRPNASFYLAVALAVLYAHSQKHSHSKDFLN